MEIGSRPTRTIAAIAAALALLAAACGGSSSHQDPSTPVTPASIASRLAADDVRLRTGLTAWRASDPHLSDPPPPAVLDAARQARALVHQTAALPPPGRREVLRDLPPALAGSVHDAVSATLALRRLAGPPSPHPSRLRLAPSPPAGSLLGSYKLAQRRYGVRWQLLAAVNLIESAFGRVTTNSSAGAVGPMQFLPATWHAYGLGGNIHDPHDAVLGAANYLHASGAPGDERRALFAYNHSQLYVAAVLAYARAMQHDPLGFLTFYAWEASLPDTI
jgi:soluble lytic murein transglycosylase-like protein